MASHHAELILEIPNSEGKPVGWIVIDSTICGRAHGGLRISQSTSQSELEMLARRMTLKFGFLGIANGGAKAGIRENPEASPEARRDMIRNFAQNSLALVRKNRYIPHPDIGTTELEIEEAFGLRSTRKLTSRKDSGYYTGLGVLAAGTVALRKQGRDWKDVTVAVEGFGKVASAFVAMAAGRGAKIVAVSTSQGALYQPKGLPVAELLQAAGNGSRFVRDFPGADVLPREDLLDLPVDLLSPCANSGSIHGANAQRIHAQIICPGANGPVTEEAKTILVSKGVLCLPDFCTSAGGILGGTMAFAGLSVPQVSVLMVQSLERRFAEMFEMSWEDAEQECMSRFVAMKTHAENGGWGQKLFQAGLGLYRHGIIPQFLVSRLATRYFLSR